MQTQLTEGRVLITKEPKQEPGIEERPMLKQFVAEEAKDIQFIEEERANGLSELAVPELIRCHSHRQIFEFTDSNSN